MQRTELEVAAFRQGRHGVAFDSARDLQIHHEIHLFRRRGEKMLDRQRLLRVPRRRRRRRDLEAVPQGSTVWSFTIF